MTRKLPQGRREARKALGGELRRLRIAAGVSASAIAQVIGASAATVSRIESGERAISPEQVRSWLQAVSGAALSGDDLEYLNEVAARATTEVSVLSGTLAARQAKVEQLTREAVAVTTFQPCFVPGLLQTADYARAVMAVAGVGPEDIEAGVLARLRRQAALGDSARRFGFVTTEAALLWKPQGTDPRPAQLDRIIAVMAFPAVTVEVIPSDAVMFTAPVCEFNLYEGEDGDGVVTIEAPHHRIETAEIKAYQDELALLRRSALSGDEAVAFIRDLAARLG